MALAPAGVFRRRLQLHAPTGTCVTAALEDDFHHFRVELVHDRRAIVEARGWALRHPWSTCPGAVARIEALAGLPLSPSPTALAAHTEARMHCTHLFDLAASAIAFAATAAIGASCQYDIAVTDPGVINIGEKTRRANLAVDGEPRLDWELRGTRITAPEPYAGQPLRGGFIAWAEATVPAADLEPALVLRRACDVAMGRMFDLDELDDPSTLMPITAGTCHSFQPEVAAVALRMKGTTRDFTNTPDALLEP